MLAVLGQIVCYTGRLLSWKKAASSDFAFEPTDADFNTKPPVKPGPDGLYPVAIPGKTKLNCVFRSVCPLIPGKLSTPERSDDGLLRFSNKWTTSVKKTVKNGGNQHRLLSAFWGPATQSIVA
jgi:hypothetical protein